MKQIVFGSLLLFVFFACNNSAEKQANTVASTTEKKMFFPVSSFIRGQLFDIGKSAVNPLKEVTSGNKKDSFWLKPEELTTAAAEFLDPVIDTANLLDLFKESKFKDETLNSITYTFEPKTELPQGFQLKRWNVYVNPETGKVTSIYMVKTRMDTTLHLLWKCDNNFTIKTVVEKPGKEPAEEKQVKITWKF